MNHRIQVQINGKTVWTLGDILPQIPGLRMLIVGKVPAPISVSQGHYFQGRQGTMFWNRLVDYGLLRRQQEFEDDDLLSHSFGITDVVKSPREFRIEPTNREYEEGISRVLRLIQQHQPRVVLFVYKRVLDRIASIQSGVARVSTYGFNPELDGCIGAPAFAFPMPGTPCKTNQAVQAMQALVAALGEGSGVPSSSGIART